MVSILATSDFHGKLPSITPCDLLILAGDITPGGSLLSQALWLETTFRAWLEKIPAKDVVMIAGNHDTIFQKNPELLPKNLPIHYLQDQEISLYGLRIYGTPWQLPFWGAFNASELVLREIYKKIPEEIDLLISHGPPYGILDEVSETIIDPDSEILHPKRHVGSLALRDAIFDKSPKYVICGHIHESFGHTIVKDIHFHNVSLLDEHMHITHSPVTLYSQAHKEV